VAIEGTSVSSLAYGIGIYLRERCNVTLTWEKTGGIGGAAARCSDPAALPPVGAPVTRARAVKWTYYQNVVDASYSYAWWDWARWEEEIAWSATGMLTQGPGGPPGPLASRLYRIPTHFSLNLHGI
jgi:alpha-N-acetylglucosaminidase